MSDLRLSSNLYAACRSGFLSYRSHDRAFVYRLKEALEQKGARCVSYQDRKKDSDAVKIMRSAGGDPVIEPLNAAFEKIFGFGSTFAERSDCWIEQGCRITGVTNPVRLIGSHCKPWRDCTNEERLDGENGLLMTPSIDHLFDRGFIGCEGDGTLIISPVAHTPSLDRMGIETKGTVNVGRVTTGQKALHHLWA